MESNFWHKKTKPFIGLSPMDGVTDAAFRYITDKYGKPDILFTEFTSVEGLARGASQLLTAFIHHKTDTPTVAQVFGATPQDFYKAAFMVAEMGFDGLDINMGCPDKNVAKKGGGAGLIRTPRLAQEIITQTKQALKDWHEGRNITDIGVTDEILTYIKNFQTAFDFQPSKRIIPVSVKTRIGYDKIVTEDWIKYLLETNPVAISIHGRTLKQLYSGLANWEEIGKAALIIKNTGTLVLGNGDIKSLPEANQKIKDYSLDGVLIGRATFGNPWLFQNRDADTATKLKVAIEHAYIFQKLTPSAHFLSLRKHLAWYCRGFDNASDLRSQLIRVNSPQEVENIINSFLGNNL